MMKTEIKIKKIEIQVGERNLELSLEEARKLHEILGELFKTEEVKEYITIPAKEPWQPWNTPDITPNDPIWPYKIWCQTTTISPKQPETLCISLT